LLEILAKAVTKPDSEMSAVEILSNTKLMDLTEFGRAVHAEMDALMACTRVGATAKGARLFCTTFPCHNCTKAHRVGWDPRGRLHRTIPEKSCGMIRSCQLRRVGSTNGRIGGRRAHGDSRGD
jgi:hypothetical protein